MSIKIELKAIIELDAPDYMNLKRFLEEMMSEHANDLQRKDLGKLVAELNLYDLEGY